jgi:glutamyl-tRNA reductase
MKNALVRNLIEKVGTKEIAVEVEALTALKPREFEEIIKKHIEKYFDYETYEKVTKPRIEEMRRKAEEVKTASLEALKRLSLKPQG